MNASQYRRANKRAYIILMMVLIYFLVTLVVGSVLNGLDAGIIVQGSIIIATIVISTIALITLPDKRVGMVMMMFPGLRAML